MRGNASPFTTDLFLSQLEYEFVIDKSCQCLVILNYRKYVSGFLCFPCSWMDYKCSYE